MGGRNAENIHTCSNNEHCIQPTLSFYASHPLWVIWIFAVTIYGGVPRNAPPSKIRCWQQTSAVWLKQTNYSLQKAAPSLHSYSDKHQEKKMLDVLDFIVEKGGDPKKIKESQKKRYEPEEAVDEVIALYEEARKGTVHEPSFLLPLFEIQGWLEFV